VGGGGAGKKEAFGGEKEGRTRGARNAFIRLPPYLIEALRREAIEGRKDYREKGKRGTFHPRQYFLFTSASEDSPVLWSQEKTIWEGKTKEGREGKKTYMP